MFWGYWVLWVVLSIPAYLGIVYQIFDNTKYLSFYYITKDADGYYRIVERCVLFPLFRRDTIGSLRSERAGDNVGHYITNIETAVNVLNRLKKRTW